VKKDHVWGCARRTRGAGGADDHAVGGDDQAGVQVRGGQHPHPGLKKVGEGVGEVACARTAARAALTINRSPSRSGNICGAVWSR
jgi:hypothetical protein